MRLLRFVAVDDDGGGDGGDGDGHGGDGGGVLVG